MDKVLKLLLNFHFHALIEADLLFLDVDVIKFYEAIFAGPYHIAAIKNISADRVATKIEYLKMLKSWKHTNRVECSYLVVGQRKYFEVGKLHQVFNIWNKVLTQINDFNALKFWRKNIYNGYLTVSEGHLLFYLGGPDNAREFDSFFFRIGWFSHSNYIILS